jgi:hypothetical protein
LLSLGHSDPTLDSLGHVYPTLVSLGHTNPTLADLGIRIIRKTQDEIVNNSVALQNDDELFLCG